MKPFLFGSSDRPLYGVYHPPTENKRKEGIVICPPFGQEYMRSHRALRQLSILLSKKGFHVLRFDYSGTGDSHGNMEDQKPSDWINDVATAVEELKETAGINRISLIGLRVGALIATAAANSDYPLDHLVLWDPVSSGADYIAELKGEIADKESSTSNFIDDEGALHFNGFPLSAAFQDELQELGMLESYPSQTQQVLELVSHQTDGFKKIKAAWDSQTGFTYRHITAPGDWNYVDKFGGILLPQPIIQGIVNWFSSNK